MALDAMKIPIQKLPVSVEAVAGAATTGTACPALHWWKQYLAPARIALQRSSLLGVAKVNESNSHAPRVDIHWIASFGDALAYAAAPRRKEWLVMLGVTSCRVSCGISLKQSRITSALPEYYSFFLCVRLAARKFGHRVPRNKRK
ncbi:hypothetical protein PInf_015127 [Phytophthora infestans]|nr:hypothetical protein PInf_015127 [Phytophthora infestans]